MWMLFTMIGGRKRLDPTDEPKSPMSPTSPWLPLESEAHDAATRDGDKLSRLNSPESPKFSDKFYSEFFGFRVRVRVLFSPA